MLEKTQIRKSLDSNVITVRTNKGCVVWSVPSASAFQDTPAPPQGTLLDVSFGVIFGKPSNQPTDEQYTPVLYDLRLGNKSIIIDATRNNKGRRFIRKPVEFKIFLPSGCALNIIPE